MTHFYTRTVSLYPIVFFFLIFAGKPAFSNSFPDDSVRKIDVTVPHEKYEGNYIPENLSERKTSPAYRYEGSGFFMTQVNVDENGDNIVGDAANEPSMAIDPTNPDRMFIGWRQFNTISNSFRQAGYGYTLDGGETWTFPGVINPGVFRSDPVLGSDASGNIYYNSLTVEGSNYYCDVYRIKDGGVEWDEGVFAQGGDKQWMAIDQTESMGEGNIYATWNSAYSICESYNFTRSYNGGNNYEDCVYVTGGPFWGTLDVSDNGDLYVGGVSEMGSFVVTRSNTAKDSTFSVFWNSAIPVDMGGWPAMGGPNPDGLLGQAWIAVDKSDGPENGNIYLLCSVTTPSDPLDVMFVRSTNGGNTWSTPLKINKDLSYDNYQWFGTMSIAPNGRIDVVWLDTRNSPQFAYYSALYYSYSLDGGLTWSENEQLSGDFDPSIGYPQQNKMGDYFHMISDNDYAHLAWANTLNGGEDVYYGRISPWFVGIDNKFDSEKGQLALVNFPNPFGDITTIRYQLNEKNRVQLTVYDVYGKLLQVLVDEEQETGMYNIEFNSSGLTEAVYYCKLTSGGQTITQKLVVGR